MTFGTFDLFHQGHISYLKQARKYIEDESGKKEKEIRQDNNRENKLIVVIARDENVKKIKGFLPKDNEEKRKHAVENAGIADIVILGNNDNIFKVLDEYKPSILCLGYDQSSQKVEEYIKEHELNIKIIRMHSFYPETFKSSKFRV